MADVDRGVRADPQEVAGEGKSRAWRNISVHVVVEIWQRSATGESSSGVDGPESDGVAGVSGAFAIVSRMEHGVVRRVLFHGGELVGRELHHPLAGVDGGEQHRHHCALSLGTGAGEPVLCGRAARRNDRTDAGHAAGFSEGRARRVARVAADVWCASLDRGVGGIHFAGCKI